MTAAFMHVSIECEGSDIFVVADGVKIAKVGHSRDASGKNMGFDRARFYRSRLR